MEPEQLLKKLIPYVQRYSDSRKQDHFVDYHDPEQLAGLLQLERDHPPGDWESLFSWVETYLRYSVNTAHPGFVNRMWAGANLPSITGEIVTALANTSACTFESAPVATLMEKYMLAEMLQLVGFENGEGQMTTGSSNGNMIAMLAARNLAQPQLKEQGFTSGNKLLAYVSEDAHYSLDKAANLLGIGTSQLVKVPVDGRGRMDTEALARMLEQARSQDKQPFFVAATLGTTVRGAYDPLPPLLKLRDQYQFWLHADGAWGGAVVLHPELRAALVPALEQVDSFTWDFHKMLGTNLMCNLLLFNNRRGLFNCVCGAGDGSYLFREEEDRDSYDTAPLSLQCGRRVDSLKWFLDWKFFGPAGFAERVARYLSLCQYAETVVHQHPELELTAPRESFNICFRFRTPPNVDSNLFNSELRTRLHHQGISLVGMGYIGSTLSLRLLITNPELGQADVATFFETLVAEGKQLLERP